MPWRNHTCVSYFRGRTYVLYTSGGFRRHIFQNLTTDIRAIRLASHVSPPTGSAENGSWAGSANPAGRRTRHSGAWWWWLDESTRPRGAHSSPQGQGLFGHRPPRAWRCTEKSTHTNTHTRTPFSDNVTALSVHGWHSGADRGKHSSGALMWQAALRTSCCPSSEPSRTSRTLCPEEWPLLEWADSPLGSRKTDKQTGICKSWEWPVPQCPSWLCWICFFWWMLSQTLEESRKSKKSDMSNKSLVAFYTCA